MKIISVIFGIFCIVLVVYTGYMHEAVHQQIYMNYGIDSEILLYQNFPHITTRPKCDVYSCELTEREFNEMNKLHIKNEIVSYNTIGLYFLLGIGLFIIIVLLEDNTCKYKKKCPYYSDEFCICNDLKGGYYDNGDKTLRPAGCYRKLEEKEKQHNQGFTIK